MGEAREVELHIMVQAAKEPKSLEPPSSSSQPLQKRRRNYNRWFKISLYVILVLTGQTVALILGRMYFVKGGNSKWMATVVQLAGFPVLIPYYFMAMLKTPVDANDTQIKTPSTLTFASIYVGLGLLIAGDCYMYSIGLQYLPVSTYTLLCASQLAFNALSSFFLNAQKYTPFIINSLVLLTISSVLLVFNNESSSPTEISKAKYAVGFVCTIAASAGYGLCLSLTQVCFRKVIKMQTFKVVMDMIIYTNLVATTATVVGLFASSEWKGLTEEMNGYQLGKVSYVMNLVWTAITWQVYSIGCVGLIFEVSSLFSNAISVLGLPIVPILAKFVFGDKLDGIKAISMVLAVWGFLSYGYQQYLDGSNSRAVNSKTDNVASNPSNEEKSIDD